MNGSASPALLALTLQASLVAACAPRLPASVPGTWASPDPATWGVLRADLASERASRPVRPWAAGVRVTMREPRTGRVVDAR